MAGLLDDVAKVATNLEREIDRIHRSAGQAVGRMGVDEMNRAATDLWGSDRKFSGSARSAKAKRAANASFRVGDDSVTITPLGDPWYITTRGRAAKVIRPRNWRDKSRRRRALRLPDGGIRSQVTGGALPARPEIVDAPTERIADKAHELMAKSVDVAARRAAAPPYVRKVIG